MANKSSGNLYWGIVDAVREIKAGRIAESDKVAILNKIREHESRADDTDVADVLNRVHNKVGDKNTD